MHTLIWFCISQFVRQLYIILLVDRNDGADIDIDIRTSNSRKRVTNGISDGGHALVDRYMLLSFSNKRRPTSEKFETGLEYHSKQEKLKFLIHLPPFLHIIPKSVHALNKQRSGLSQNENRKKIRPLDQPSTV